MAESRVTAFLPGLLGPLPDEMQTLPGADALAGLLAAAVRRRTDRQSRFARLAADFGIEHEPPVAVLSYLADFGSLPSQSCFCCDPVHLQADMAQALLYDSRSFDLSAEEAGQLVTAFNRHFAEDKLQLVFRDPRRWYLLADNPPPLRAPPLDEVVGRNAGAFLPQEPADARYWNRILNETQMLFFGLPVNYERESRGLPAVNGVWIYGGSGSLNGSGSVSFDAVYSDDAFCKGLALHSGVPVRPWAEVFEAGFRQVAGSRLLCNNAAHDALLTGDSARWSALLTDWDARLFAPLRQQWRAGKLAQMTIDPDNGCRYHAGPGGAGSRLRGLVQGALHRMGRGRNGLAAFIDKQPTGKNFRP